MLETLVLNMRTVDLRHTCFTKDILTPVAFFWVDVFFGILVGPKIEQTFKLKISLVEENIMPGGESKNELLATILELATITITAPPRCPCAKISDSNDF